MLWCLTFMIKNKDSTQIWTKTNMQTPLHRSQLEDVLHVNMISDLMDLVTSWQLSLSFFVGCYAKTPSTRKQDNFNLDLDCDLDLGSFDPKTNPSVYFFLY